LGLLLEPAKLQASAVNGDAPTKSMVLRNPVKGSPLCNFPEQVTNPVKIRTQVWIDGYQSALNRSNRFPSDRFNCFGEDRILN